jgi:dihydroflavonol-4-reductase
MRAFVTGATGFIGSRVAQKLRERGDDVVVLVRSPQKAAPLRELGCEIVEGDLASADAIRQGVQGADAVLHVAADYRIGIAKDKQGQLEQANVAGTALVLDSAIDAGVAKIVHVSTGNVFGNTHGSTVDESYRRDVSEGFLSKYDETKYQAHQLALERIAAGAPVVIVQPGAVYGPGDRSQIANMIRQTRVGKMKLLMFPDFALDYVHVDDIADGIIAAHDRGRVGESYILGGEAATMRDLITTVAELSGRKPPTRAIPGALIRASVPLGPVVGKAMGMGPNLGELVRTSDGVTILMTDAKAREELGYAPRALEDGLRETLAAEPV